MSSQLQPLGDWVEQLFNKIFFQSDDSLAATAYEGNVDPSLVVRINHDRFNFDQYKEAIVQTRAGNTAGAVAHLTKFTIKNKATGQETKSSSLILSAVKWIDGKRRLTEITEVSI